MHALHRKAEAIAANVRQGRRKDWRTAEDRELVRMMDRPYWTSERYYPGLLAECKRRGLA